MAVGYYYIQILDKDDHSLLWLSGFTTYRSLRDIDDHSLLWLSHLRHR